MSDEERLVRDQTKNYAQSKLLPRVTQGYRDESFDKNIMKEMGDLGLLGATIEGSKRFNNFVLVSFFFFFFEKHFFFCEF